jgi:cell division protein FtsL
MTEFSFLVLRQGERVVRVSSNRVASHLGDKVLSLFEVISSLISAVSFKGIVITVLLLSSLMLSAVGVVYSSHLSRQLFAEQAILLERNDQLQLEWAQLLLEQSAWSSPGRIESIASEEVGMSVPESNQMEILY